MIEKILERLEEAFPINPYPNEFTNGRNLGIKKAIQIVQEVAKEYGKDTNVRSNEYEMGYEDGAESVRALTPYEDGWIPVEERLPETWEDVLVWCEGRFTCGIHIGEKCQCHGIGYRLPANDWEVEVLKAFDEDSITVLAWHPIAPYQKGE